MKKFGIFLFAFLLIGFASAGWTKSGDLQIGNNLFLVNGEKVEIINIKEVNEIAEVFNLKVSDNFENYFANNVLVHNKNGKGVISICGTDCVVGGRSPVAVLYPDGTIREMPISKFRAKFQENPYLRLVNSRGKPVGLSEIKEVRYSGKVVSFEVEGTTIKLTPDHLIQLPDSTFVPSQNVRNGMFILTPEGPKRISNYRVYTADRARVFSPITNKDYALTSRGPVLKTPVASEGIVLGRPPCTEPIIRPISDIQSTKFDEKIYVRFENANRVEWPKEKGIGNLPFESELVNPQRGPKISCFSLDQLERANFFQMTHNQKIEYLKRFGIDSNLNREIVFFKLEEGTFVEMYPGRFGSYYNIVIEEVVPSVQVIAIK